MEETTNVIVFIFYSHKSRKLEYCVETIFSMEVGIHDYVKLVCPSRTR